MKSLLNRVCAFFMATVFAASMFSCAFGPPEIQSPAHPSLEHLVTGVPSAVQIRSINLMPSGARSAAGAVVNDGEMTFGEIVFNSIDATSVNFDMRLASAEGAHVATVTSTMYLSNQVAFVGGDPVPVFTGTRAMAQAGSSFENAILVEGLGDASGLGNSMVLDGLAEVLEFVDGIDVSPLWGLEIEFERNPDGGFRGRIVAGGKIREIVNGIRNIINDILDRIFDDESTDNTEDEQPGTDNTEGEKPGAETQHKDIDLPGFGNCDRVGDIIGDVMNDWGDVWGETWGNLMADISNGLPGQGNGSFWEELFGNNGLGEDQEGDQSGNLWSDMWGNSWGNLMADISNGLPGQGNGSFWEELFGNSGLGDGFGDNPFGDGSFGNNWGNLMADLRGGGLPGQGNGSFWDWFQNNGGSFNNQWGSLWGNLWRDIWTDLSGPHLGDLMGYIGQEMGNMMGNKMWIVHDLLENLEQANLSSAGDFTITLQF